MLNTNYDWNDEILDNFFPIFCAGFEHRCFGFLASLPNTWRSDNAILLSYPRTFFPQNEKNRRIIFEILKEHTKNLIEIQLTTGYSIETIEKLLEAISQFSCNNDNVVIDISSITRGNMLSFMKILTEKRKKIYLAYTEPIDYEDIYNYGTIDLVIVPGFEGEMDEEKENLCVYLMGFNKRYIDTIREIYDPTSETFFVGNISKKYRQKRNQWNEKAQKIVKNFRCIPILVSPLDIKSVTHKIITEFNSKI